MPRDPLAVERASPADLLIVAQTRLRERQKLPTYTLYLAWLHFLMLLKQIFRCCGTTKFGRALSQGKAQMRRELNLFNFLRKQRQTAATLLAITTHEQRRLIKQQVKAGLYVAPPSEPKPSARD